MANLIDMISQLAQIPLNVIDAYNKGVQTRRGEEDRQLQRQQLLQQIEGMIQDTRRKKAEATLQEEELLPEAVSARSKKRQADIVKSEADIEFTVPERKAGLAQTYAQTDASRASAASSRANAALSNIQRQRQQLQLQTEQATQAGDIAAINATNQQRRQLAEMTTQLLSDPSYRDLWSEAQRGQLVGQAIASRTELLSQQAESSRLVRQLSEDGVAIATLPVQQKQAVIQAEAAIQQAKEFLENGDVRSAENTAKHMEAIVKSAVASATLPQVKQRLQLELEKLLADIDKSKAETKNLERGGTKSSETERMVNYVSMFEGKKQRDPTWIPTPEEKVTYDRYTNILEKKGTVTGRTEQDVRDRVIYRENKRSYQQGVETLGMINTALQQVELKHGGGAGFVTATWGNLKDFIGGFWEATRGVESPDQMMEVMKRDALLNGDAEVFKMLESASQVGYTNALYTGLKYTLAKSLSEKDRIGVDDMVRMDALLGGIKGGQVNKGALYAARDMIKNKAGQAYAEFKSQETGVQYGYKPEYDAVYYKSGDLWIKDPYYGR